MAPAGSKCATMCGFHDVPGSFPSSVVKWERSSPPPSTVFGKQPSEVCGSSPNYKASLKCLQKATRIFLDTGINRLPWWLSGKEPACQCRRHGLDSWVRKIPWRRRWQPTPVFLPGKSHGQRSLAGYRPWVCRVGCDLVTKQQQTSINH